MRKRVKFILVLLSIINLFGVVGTIEYSDLIGQPVGDLEGIWMLIKYSAIPYGLSELM